jgi:hypothetical protein
MRNEQQSWKEVRLLPQDLLALCAKTKKKRPKSEALS